MNVILENEVILLVSLVLLAWMGYKFRALSLSGAFGTFVVGVLIVIGFKGEGLILIGAFFISSSFWSKFSKKKKTKTVDLQEKGSQRDIIQVFANGGVPAGFSLGFFFFPSEAWLVGFITAIAVANSDTWASEIGVLSKKKPISIKTLTPVESGQSGAISGLGTAAAVVGSAFIAVISMFLWEEITWSMLVVITLLGIIGCFVDTVIGASLQAIYQCQNCGKVVERKFHCEQATTLIKGVTLVNNDVVNICSILIVTTLAWVLYWV
ncbi:DUF92 domain-containing protein [Sutcliffiella halmapala]|uniref:DUF92 domain-containing protein n=1 Tax=Sutcliffiella halmapala TaxID=79882 RepID=UPI001116DD63|nr:DUF92 domain-containing protein [Sutcliffiella halmapala]